VRAYRRHNGDEDAIIVAYAVAEMRGEVNRDSNRRDLSAEDYARRLLEDARKRVGCVGLADLRAIVQRTVKLTR